MLYLSCLFNKDKLKQQRESEKQMKILESTTNFEILNNLVERGIMPKTQKGQAKIFGVRESTINGWINKNQFPDYARVIMSLLSQKNYLEQNCQETFQLMQSTIPVEFQDKILLVKLDRRHSAIYYSDLVGDVIAECADADNATYIMDFIN